MGIYGNLTKGSSRCGMGIRDLMLAGVSMDAVSKRAEQVAQASFRRDMANVRMNEASSFKQLRHAADQYAKALVHIEYMNELIRLEPVAGPWYRPEEIKGRWSAMQIARQRRKGIVESVNRLLHG